MILIVDESVIVQIMAIGKVFPHISYFIILLYFIVD